MILVIAQYYFFLIYCDSFIAVFESPFSWFSGLADLLYTVCLSTSGTYSGCGGTCFNPRTLEVESGRALSLRLAWCTQCDPG